MDSLESSFRIVPAAIRPCGGGTLEIEVNDEEHNTILHTDHDTVWQPVVRSKYKHAKFCIIFLWWM